MPVAKVERMPFLQGVSKPSRWRSPIRQGIDASWATDINEHTVGVNRNNLHFHASDAKVCRMYKWNLEGEIWGRPSWIKALVTQRFAINYKMTMANQEHRCINILFKRLTIYQSESSFKICNRHVIDCKPLRYGAQQSAGNANNPPHASCFGI